MEYMRAVQYIFESSKWVTNLLWGSLCIISTIVIPIVGQLVLIGYQFEIVERLAIASEKTGYPDFDINRFKEYLLRGLWVFLVMLVLMLVIMPIMFVLLLVVGGVVGGIGAATNGDQEAMTIGTIVVVALGSVFMIFFMAAMSVVMTPLTIRAGLTQDFRASFDATWIKDFTKRMWVETLLAQMFVMVVAIGAALLGYLACFIGIFPANAFIFLVQGHLYMQLYRMYLGRGGEPIPLKPATPFQPAA